MKRILVILILTLVVLEMKSQQLAFPGAEGFGRFATGGRGGSVYHVTNLNDSGPGSFRDAVSQPNRIVVFDVGGVIHISTRIVIKRNITIAGQTAPGDGITIYGNGIALNGDSGNDIIRYIRIRMGKNGDSGKDAVGISDGQDYIFDHVSVSWGRDGTFDVNGSYIDRWTVQDCIISQGINNSNHSTGGLMQSGDFSVIRTLWIDNKTRNPKARNKHEFINSVLYNWGTNGYIMGDTDGLSECNLMGNYFIYGPSSSSNSHITGTTPSFHVYALDNWVDDNKNGVLDGYEMIDYKTATVENSPFGYSGVNQLMTASDALANVIDHAGASLVRDPVDDYLIDQLKSYGTKGQIINTEDDNEIAGNVGILQSGEPMKDTDGDGMPDYFEEQYGFDKSIADHNADLDQDGFTNIEEYINCLAGACDFATEVPPIESGNWKLKSGFTGYCVNYDAAGITLHSCVPSLNIGWELTRVEGLNFMIKSIFSNAYLTVVNTNQLGFTNQSSNASLFRFEKATEPYFTISLKDSDLMLAVEDGIGNLGSRLILTSTPVEDSQVFMEEAFQVQYDCMGVAFGDAATDQCGVCVGGTSSNIACEGYINGEDYCDADGVFENTNKGYLGAGYLNFDNANGSSSTFLIESETEQSVQMTFRYANGGAASRPMEVYVNNVLQSGTISFPKTANWTTWETAEFAIDLNDCINEIKLVATSSDGGPNLDMIYHFRNDVSPASCSASVPHDCMGNVCGAAFINDCGECVSGNLVTEPCEEVVLASSSQSAISIYPNPSEGEFMIFSNGLRTMKILDVSGKVIINDLRLIKGSNEFHLDLKPGIYFLDSEFENQSSLRIIIH